MFQLSLQVWPDYFGRKNIGTILGYSAPFGILPLTLGPLFVAWAHDLTGNYVMAFGSFAITSALGGVLMLFTPPPKPKGKVQAERSGRSNPAPTMSLRLVCAYTPREKTR